MKRSVLVCIIFACSGLVTAQNPTMDETRERQRKNVRPIPVWEINEAKVYKLKGFTDSTQLNFSRKSDCEFNCYQLADASLRSILINGQVNISKSDLNRKPSPYYAVEGSVNNGELYRVVASPDGEALRIISLYKLDKKMACNCKE